MFPLVREIQMLKKYIEHLENINKNYLRLLKLAGISGASAVEMGDRNWKKPLKYSNKVFLESDESTKMKDLVKDKKSKSSIDNDEEDEESDDSETSESENKSSVGNEMIQVLNAIPIQQSPQVQYVILSTGGPNGAAQLFPICSTPVLPSNQQNVFLSNNVTSAPTTSQISLAKVHQDNSINIKVNANKKSTKTKKKNADKKCNDDFLGNGNKSSERPSGISLTTTIERCEKGASESTKKCTATEPDSVLENKSFENKEQSGKRNSVSEKHSIEVNKKPKTGDSGQQTSSKNTSGQQEKAKSLARPTDTMSLATSPIVYQVDDDSNDSQLAVANGQTVAEKAAPTVNSVNSASNRCNYSTESLLQPQGESQSNSSQQNTSGMFSYFLCSQRFIFVFITESSNNNLNQQSQSSQNDHQSSYHQQQPSAPSFTVKDSLMNNSPAITSSSNSIEKHNFDLNSSISSLCTSKRNMPFENIEALGISSSATTPNLFDSNMLPIAQSDNQQLMSSLVSSWAPDPSASHSSGTSVNASNGSQSFSNANSNSVLFANQPPFSLLSTTPTSFESSVSNSVFGSSSHKALSSNSSNAFNFISELNSVGSYSLSNIDDQSNNNNNPNSSSIIDNFPRSSVATATTSSSRASNALRSSTAANNTTASSAITSSYSKVKSTNSSKATTSTSASSTRITKSSATSLKKSTTKSSSAATSANSEPKFPQATTSMSSSTVAASANLFSRHHHHHHHHTHPAHPSHRPLANDAFPSFPIISDPMTFLSVTSAAGHSSSVMSTSTATSAPATFHPHHHAHHSHQPFPHSSYSNFFTTSSQSEQAVSGLAHSSYDNRSYEAAQSANDASLSHNEQTEHNQLMNYPIYLPQPQANRSSFVAPTTSSAASYQPSTASTNSSVHSRNFSNPPPMYSHHSSSSHVTNFNIGCLLPDSALSSPGSGSYGTADFFSSASKTAAHSSAKSTSSSTSMSSSAPIVSNTGLPKFAQLTKSLPPTVAPIVVDPLAPSASYHQNATTASTAAHHQYHPATHPAFYHHPPPPHSQTSVTYSSHVHPLNTHFTSSSASQSRNSSVRNNSSFAGAEEVDASGSSSASLNTRSSSSLAGHHYYPIATHNSGVSDMFNSSVGSVHQNSGHHNQPLSTHHIGQHNHFPPPNAPSTHNFNQPSAVPASVANFNLQSSISTSTAGPTPPTHRLLSLHF